MRFLTEREIDAEIKRQLAAGSSLKAAVAFWGAGAQEALQIKGFHGRVKIVCNLRMGGTNPHEIEKLTKLRSVTVKHRDDLHAKVYLFDNAAIVGSSNASANGLAFQGGDGLSWREANILVQDITTLRTISKWFEKVFRQAKPVEKPDIAVALEAWRKRRSGISIGMGKPRGTLLDAAKKNPAQFADRKIYVVLNDGDMSEDAKLKLSQLREEVGTSYSRRNLDLWENWPTVPNGAKFVDFHRGTGGRIRYLGLYSTPDVRKQFKLPNGDSVQLCFRESHISGMKVGDLRAWRKAVKLAEEKLLEREMPLDIFARKYLSD